MSSVEIANMGSRVTRLIRNFNVENRAHREISKTKPKTAPRHPSSSGFPQEDIAATSISEEVQQRNDPLLSMLKDVYVESKDPVSQAEAVPVVKKVEQKMQRRALKYSIPGDPYGFCDVTDVPKGRLSLVEALTALNNHKRLPKTWTPEKLAQEYSLDPKDAKALTDFFFPFDVKIIPPKTEETKQIKDS
ncbi:NADH dehydrogenase [ubiquinone] 1 alpha subcomplex assembly factor 4-like [Sinocyclocheilus anshuiensis]|uniref:NADH dehydrogenase [ubiquinone] 1 alpha subcomplex assembly factor 4 n=1 Tax=Sinocyclocheilus anshuiensis TaxID=1608454 RepID=A0A671SZJ8_9TELE|nr:PREDICTED: NADH dehydrogenase [ubiquinone] 1 alpha subcomplex assembly factor 4-like [Sinocyclocheilus anshuiensis]